MVIRVVPVPATLAWALFTPVDSLDDGEDAHTKMKYTIQNAQVKHANGVYSIRSATLTVAPIVTVLKTANKTPDLLAHEQGHYNIGILIGRAMAQELEGLTGTDRDSMKTAMDDVFDKHSTTLMAPIQKLYDKEADGSHNAAGQGRWNAMIASALGSATPLTR